MQCHLSLKRIRVLIKYLILDFYFRRDFLVLCCEPLRPAGAGVSVARCHRVLRQAHDSPPRPQTGHRDHVRAAGRRSQDAENSGADLDSFLDGLP